MIKYILGFLCIVILPSLFDLKKSSEANPKYTKHIYFYWIALWIFVLSLPLIPFQYLLLYLALFVVIILFWMCREKETRVKVFRFTIKLLIGLILLGLLFIFLGQWLSGGKF